MAPQSANPGLGSTYSSNTLYVGDGTWDSQRNTYLLPPLVGLNFATMRANGMSVRFQNLPGYHNIIVGHGVLAAITFLFIVPLAILFARFYNRDRHLAHRVHIWLQILTLLLTTVIFALGWFAVGPKRSLTNPHHGIGLAIYVLILWQAITGWWMRGREKDRERLRKPLKVVLHQWLGRAIAILGIVQIPLGLTLYGAQKYLFILYTLWMTALLITYFTLSYRHAGVLGGYTSGSRSDVFVERKASHSRLGKLAAAGAAGAGLAALQRHRNRSRSRTDVVLEDPNSPSRRSDHETFEEKESIHEGGGFGRRLLQGGALAGAALLARDFFGRRRDRSPSPDPHRIVGHGGRSASASSVSRLEEGNLSHRDHHPVRNLFGGLRRSRSEESISEASHKHHDSHVGEGLATLGALGLARSLWKSRKDKKEEERLSKIRQQDIRDERLARAGSKKARLTGDGIPGRRHRRDSVSSTDSLDDRDRRDRRDHHGINPVVAAVGGAAAGAALAGAASHRRHSRSDVNIHNVDTGSEEYVSAGGGHRRRHHNAGEALAAGAAGAAAAEALGRHDRHHGSSGSETARASVKVRVHPDGRNVTVRRLTDDERAAEAAARRGDRDRSAGRHSRDGARLKKRRSSRGSHSGNDSESDWKRTERLERQQAEEMRRETELAAERRAEEGYGGGPSNIPPPPPIPTGDVASSVSAAEIDDERRRRRAKGARPAYRRGGNSVDWD